MTWQLAWTGPALKDIDGLDTNHARCLDAALTRLARTNRSDYRKLAESKPTTWRLRVGPMRGRFRYIRNTKQILVLRVLPRESAYRR